MQSDTVTELLPALLAAMADMKNPQKNARNPHFKNQFADLGQVLDCLREPLHDNDLVMTQHADGDVLRTRVWHSKSGQWIESSVRLVMDKQTAQAQGSAITYARRYALKALFAMHDVDDDGQEASKPRKKQQAEEQKVDYDVVPYIGTSEDALAEIWQTQNMVEWTKLAQAIGAAEFTAAEKKELREAMAERKAELIRNP